MGFAELKSSKVADVFLAQFLALYPQNGEEMITIISAVKVDKYCQYKTRFATFVSVQPMQQWVKNTQGNFCCQNLIQLFLDQLKRL